jgi:hypothetical protein
MQGSRFTDLMARMKGLPFGSKLQNHPLDNRLNDEVRRKYNLPDNLLPVQPANIGTAKARKISIDFLSHGNIQPLNAANFIVDVIRTYVEIIEQNQNSYLDEVENSNGAAEIASVIRSSFEYEADARLFEIVSHALLYLHYKQQVVYFGYSSQQIQPTPLILHKTGRTNANDGGIDFVLQPLGKFYQVTETLDFKKYFLDFDKMNRFPLSFVIKTGLLPEAVKEKIHSDASRTINAEVLQRYMGLFDEIITLNELDNILVSVLQSPQLIQELKETVINSFRLEYGMLD